MAGYTLLIGIASGGTIRAETVTSLIGALDVIKSHGVGAELRIQVGGYTALNRNQLVRAALERNASHLLFVDNDMVFAPSSIQRLLDADKDIIGVNYNSRGTPGKPIVSTMKLVDPATMPEEHKGIPLISQWPAQLFSLYALGTGFMLIKTDVFRNMQAPWFVAGEDEKGEAYTEDVEFCRKAHVAGYDVWCSPTITMGHIGTKEY